MIYLCVLYILDISLKIFYRTIKKVTRSKWLPNKCIHDPFRQCDTDDMTSDSSLEHILNRKFWLILNTLNRDRFNGSKEAKFPRSQVHCLENAPANAFTIYSRISQLLRSPYEIILVWPELNARLYGEIAHKMTTWVFCTNSLNEGVTLLQKCRNITTNQVLIWRIYSRLKRNFQMEINRIKRNKLYHPIINLDKCEIIEISRKTVPNYSRAAAIPGACGPY